MTEQELYDLAFEQIKSSVDQANEYFKKEGIDAYAFYPASVKIVPVEPQEEIT